MIALPAISVSKEQRRLPPLVQRTVVATHARWVTTALRALLCRTHASQAPTTIRLCRRLAASHALLATTAQISQCKSPLLTHAQQDTSAWLVQSTLHHAPRVLSVHLLRLLIPLHAKRALPLSIAILSVKLMSLISALMASFALVVTTDPALTSQLTISPRKLHRVNAQLVTSALVDQQMPLSAKPLNTSLLPVLPVVSTALLASTALAVVSTKTVMRAITASRGPLSRRPILLPHRRRWEPSALSSTTVLRVPRKL